MARLLDMLFPGYVPWQVAIEIAVIWICVYLVFRFLQGTRGAGLIKGFALLLVVGTLAIKVLGGANDGLIRLNFIYDRFMGLLAILLVVVFQPELRQAMSRLGRAWSFRLSGQKANGVVEAVAEAVAFLSKSQFGALIAIERSDRLGRLIEAVAQLDAQVSARLLESIFWPNSPLHDLGVVIRDDRIVAASVQFPLAEEGVLPIEYGSRHRAAAGVTEESDCLVVIVSEETGAISIAEHGIIEHDIGRAEFKDVLAKRLAATPEPGGPPESTATTSAATTTESDPDEKRAA